MALTKIYLQHISATHAKIYKIILDVFYQQSVARRFYITPVLPKSLKPTADVKSDKWLYSSKFAEQLKDVQTVETVCATIKAANKNVLLRLDIRETTRTHLRDTSRWVRIKDVQ